MRGMPRKVSIPEGHRKMLADLDLVRIARDAALAAADYIRTTGRPRGPSAWDEKSTHDFVSDVDRGAEELIREHIAKAAPGTHVIGEELGPELALAGTPWIVEPIHVSTIRDPGRALIGTGFPFKDLTDMNRYVGQFRQVAAATAGIRRPGSAALDLCSVASGEYDAFWEL